MTVEELLAREGFRRTMASYTVVEPVHDGNREHAATTGIALPGSRSTAAV